jgi:hypothetical protein
MKSLRSEVLDFVERGRRNDAARFDAPALQLFRWHLEAIPEYRRFCLTRLPSLGDARGFRDIPPLPAVAFKHAELSAVPPDRRVRRFTTSGTSGGARPGVAALCEDALAIMDRAIEINAGRCLFPGEARPRVFVLTPPPEIAPHVVMVHGMSVLVRRFGAPESRFFGGRDGLDVDALVSALAAARRDGAAVCLVGASFAFVQLLDALAARGVPAMRLPDGSRAMDAGGYKGRSRTLEPSAFRATVSAAFGLDDTAVVNLLGMTELASQAYDDCLVNPSGRRRKVAPAWMRTCVVDVDDPRVEVADGQVGLLAHWDLANYSRPIAVLSEDLGVRRGDGFEIIGRVESAEARGCSVTLDRMWGAA